MKDVRLGSFALAALVVAGSAQAADPNGAPVYKAPPLAVASSWTGFYAGLGLGFRASRTDLTTTSAVTAVGPISLTGVATSQPFDGTAFRANPYVGFNWQFAPRWVAGIEGDAGFGSRSTTLGGFPSTPGSGESDFAEDTLAVRITWDASLHGRLGFLLTPAMMAYVTGGSAWQRYDVASTCGFTCKAVTTPIVVANSTTKAGWTVGGGIETALWGHWLARAEYRYADFGATPFTIARTGVARVDNFDVKLRTHTATFGLAYKFGDPVASDYGGASSAFAASAASATMSWNGLYTGLGLGARTSRTDLTTTSEFFQTFRFDISRFANSQPIDGAAFRATPYMGFNWQFAPRWVAGLESDGGFAHQTTTLAGLEFSPGFGGDNLAVDGLAVKTTWDASLRGRLGFLLTPETLAYATGGAAWQHYDVISACVGKGGTCGGRAYNPGVVTNSATKQGWTVGAGLETAFWGPWLARGEYRYANFGTSSFTIARSSTNPFSNPTVDTFDVKLRTQTVNFGIAYTFN